MTAEKRKLTVGMLAHVDAGKTTLTEALLYSAGVLRKMGRVDHADAFLDNDERERERGITIFSKQARLDWGGSSITLLDTPGHTDFSGEAERTMPVLDAAILVISASDGVQGHTRTLWRLLERYEVPVFLFVNKMDRPDTDRTALLQMLRQRLSDRCADFGGDDWPEQAAGESEEALDSYLDTGSIPAGEVRRLIGERKLFPCLFGAALRGEGVEALLNALDEYAPARPVGTEQAALCYKISRDSRGERLTWLRVTGGSVPAKEVIEYRSAGGELLREKIHQIRLYSGEKFTQTESAGSGELCCVTGLTESYAGGGLGAEKGAAESLLQPVFSYRVVTGRADPFTVWQKLRLLEEEEPLLRLSRNELTGELHVQLMGQVQSEILQRLLHDRFALDVSFDEGRIVYKETIAGTVEGVGHYEPLRHYAEVHLLMEAGERGSGLVIGSDCPTDELDLNWQRLILTHLREKLHRGVLTGAPITDMHITLKSGRAHLKHTEGGDFRQATYRAVRQGLMQAQSVLLEPWFDVRLELPPEFVGRAMTDLQRMGGEFDAPETADGECILTGCAPVAELGDYSREVAAYTGGCGRCFCSLRGYEPCRDAAAVIIASGYDAERDTENPSASVFCEHGAGFNVPWNEVRAHMHLPSCLAPRRAAPSPASPAPARQGAPVSSAQMDKKLQAIFEQTYGPVKNRDIRPRSEAACPAPPQPAARPVPQGPEYVLVDGYNIIFAWEELRSVAKDNTDAARQLLMDCMSNYQGVRGCILILVFDAYRLPYHKEEILRYHNIHVVYTREAETADAYIEKAAHEIAREHRVRVATSDSLEQLIILGQGALRQSAEAFRAEVEQAGDELHGILEQLNSYRKTGSMAEAFRRAGQNSSGGDQT